ncbi:DUF2092 domain-containing protein [uncultured Algoriphagus sp.]|uniref:DUF2092 domain-containing protein n=1 Tax=uncultured Algoriphagus sp. TaxID=417365 RepID=UPI002595D7AC|nr:DUF2092 domain-containing protein [uncultured Algoriphagus sp.]
MKKVLFFSLIAFCCFFRTQAQEVFHDSTALLILDKVGAYFGEVNSLKFNTKTSQDVGFRDDFFIKEFRSGEFIIQGPNQLSAKVIAQGKPQYYFYNGSQIVYYSLEDKIFVASEAPDNTLDMLESLYTDFGIQLVAADFLYPDFAFHMTETMDYIEYLGEAEVHGQKCFHIGAANAEMTFQIWVSQDLEARPAKIVVTYLGEPYAHQVEVTFENWEINETYPDSIFEFLPPPNSKQITWTKKD